MIITRMIIIIIRILPNTAEPQTQNVWNSAGFTQAES